MNQHMKYNSLLATCFCLCFCCLCIAQHTLTGEILEEDTGEPLIGANVIVKGTSDGTSTDWDGSFSFKTSREPPFEIVITYTGFQTRTVEITNPNERLKLFLSGETILIESVEVRGKRISERQKSAPLTVESLDIIAIKETPAANFYDGLGALKDVDLTAASLGFKIINTRGFNSTSPVRSLQIIDGMDNQAPGLNFSLGNFLGSPELDVLRVDIVAGASSAYYGPNAFNGVISIQSKDPFIHRGLSAMAKAGERNLFEGAFRWADALTNKEGEQFFACKVNFFALRANDWEAENYDPVFDTRNDRSNPGGYDAVNIYGDGYYSLNDVTSGGNIGNRSHYWTDPGLRAWHRTGYREVDLVDYDTRNYKANLALHLRTRPGLDVESPELILASSFGSGTTVYQGDNRFSLKNIRFFQNRLEYRKRDKFFIRAYATHENAGDSYDPYFTALKLQQEAKNNEDWSLDYRRYWKSIANYPAKMRSLGYPNLIYDPATMQFSFDYAGADQWLSEYADSLFLWHAQAAAFANKMTDAPNHESVDFFEPGTERFNTRFEEITSSLSNTEEGGTRFYDKSALYHLHGEYTIKPLFIHEIRLGANVRMYRPDSKGTIFYDTAGTRITNSEFGVYAGIQEKFALNKLTASATFRLDKNENFPAIFTPAASLVYSPQINTYLRFSFSSALRNPTLSDQYLNLNVGPAILAGNINGVDSLLTIDSFRDFLNSRRFDDLEYFNIDPIRPERVKTFELGLRHTLFEALYVDAGVYYSIYNDFLGYQIGIDASINTNDPLALPSEVTVYRYASNSTSEVRTRGASIGLNYYLGDLILSGNYSWNDLVKDAQEDPIIPAFNTPEHKFNLGLGGRDLSLNILGLEIDHFGFNINYKWVEGFIFEGSPQFTGFVPSYDLLDAQINYHFTRANTTLKIGGMNLLNNKHFETYGGPRIGRLTYISLLYEFKKK